jgi:hypothetical protein
LYYKLTTMTTRKKSKEPFSLRLEESIIQNLGDETPDMNKRSIADLTDTIFMAYFAMTKQERIEFLSKSYQYNGKRLK